MGILSDQDKQFIQQKFAKELKATVPMVYLNSPGCDVCDTLEQLLKELTELSNSKIDLKINQIGDFHKKILGVDRGPIVLMGNHAEIRYTGAPLGEEAWAFLETIVLLSTGNHQFKQFEDTLSSLKYRVKIETIVTPQCPVCPHSALLAHNIAVASRGKVISDVVEAYEFPEIAEKYHVTAVPTVVLSVNGNYTGDIFSIGLPQATPLIKKILELGKAE